MTDERRRYRLRWCRHSDSRCYMVGRSDVGKALSCGNMFLYTPAATMLYSICTKLAHSSSADSSISIGGCHASVKLLTMHGLERSASPTARPWWMRPSVTSVPWKLCKHIRLSADSSVSIGGRHTSVKLLMMHGPERSASLTARPPWMCPSVNTVL